MISLFQDEYSGNTHQFIQIMVDYFYGVHWNANNMFMQNKDVLSKVSGLEIARLVGVIIGAASRSVPVDVDVFISGTAALVAAKQVPEVSSYLIASHQSVKIGHQVTWQTLGLGSILYYIITISFAIAGKILFIHSRELNNTQ